MKKVFALLLSAAMAVLLCVPAFAATKAETVTVSLSTLEEANPRDADTLIQEIQYLAYCNDVIDRDSGMLQTDSTAQAKAAAREKLDRGYISQKQYDDAVQAADDLSLKQTTESNQRAESLLKLRNLLELDFADKLIVKPADYSKINLDKKLSNVHYDKNLKDWVEEFSVDNAQYINSFKSAYDTMKLANAAYASDQAKYETKKADAAAMQQKFATGYATQKQVDDINRELQALQYTVDKDRNSVYSAYLIYDFMRDQGYNPLTGVTAA